MKVEKEHLNSQLHASTNQKQLLDSKITDLTAQNEQLNAQLQTSMGENKLVNSKLAELLGENKGLMLERQKSVEEFQEMANSSDTFKLQKETLEGQFIN